MVLPRLNNGQVHFRDLAWFDIEFFIAFVELGGCKDGVCKCNLGGNQEDGGIIIESWKLPVQKVKFGSSDGTRTVKVGPVVCSGKLFVIIIMNLEFSLYRI
jgi:hypothetical protein